jgi:hypothetical protein
MALIQVTNGYFSIHNEIDTNAYLFTLISWWSGGILEGVQGFDGRRILSSWTQRFMKCRRRRGISVF